MRKSDIVREAVGRGDWKSALRMAKDFRINVTAEERKLMGRAYECIVHPAFYEQIGTDIPAAIAEGKAVVAGIAARGKGRQ